jgi:cholest-4-en-3-one 26-monooxygenase
MTSTLDFDLTDPAVFADGPPHSIFDELREHAPVYGQPHPSGGTIWSLTRHADVREASINVAVFSSAQGIVFPNSPERLAFLRENMMFNDPPVHTRLRAFAAKAFSPAVVARFEQWIRELCADIADDVLRREGAFDAIENIAAALPARVITTILGVPEKDRAALVKLIMRGFAESDPDIGQHEARAASTKVADYSIELRELKRRQPGVDMATELATADGHGNPLTDEEYRQMMLTLITAGFETTHTLIAQSLVLATRDQKVRSALDTPDRGVLKPAVDELLRLVSPAMYFARTATSDVQFHGTRISAGDLVMLWFAAANRDPAVFGNPHEFELDRPRRNHFAFGGGSPHFCIGNHLARLEVELLFQEFAQRGLRLELAGEPVRLPGILINGLRKLPMRVL